MPTRNINLTDHFDRIIEEAVAAGEYQNASEVVRAALRLWKRQRQEDEARLQALRQAVQAGIDELDRGQYSEIKPDEIGDYIRQLRKRASTRLKAKS